MDPDACLRLALHAIIDGDRHAAVDALVDLAHWLDRGGHMPIRTQLQKVMLRDLLERMPP